MSRVLVTGAASGLGLALTRAFAARGDQVLATDRALEAPADVLPDGVLYRALDVTSDDDWLAARAFVEQEWVGLDVLVNNAGVATGGRIDKAPMAEWQRAVDINLLGVARGCVHFAPLLKTQRSGTIVNVASLAGLVHGPGMAPYNAVKAGVVALSETLHFELAPFGVRTSVVCPSFFRTDLADSMSGADEAAERATRKLIADSPLSADDIAAAVLAGLDRGDHVILTDDLARAMVHTKVTDRAAYDQAFLDGAERLAHRELQGETR